MPSGPSGQGNLAQGLPWEIRKTTMSPVGAAETCGMPSAGPSGLIRKVDESRRGPFPRLKPGLGSGAPSGLKSAAWPVRARPSIGEKLIRTKCFSPDRAHQTTGFFAESREIIIAR